MMGFEPMRVFKDPTSLAVRRFRPTQPHLHVLSHYIPEMAICKHMNSEFNCFIKKSILTNVIQNI